MAGIYLHIPFCRQACHYCNFHFTTSLRNKEDLVNAIAGETVLQKQLLQGEAVHSVYFGGGTPSLLEVEEIALLLKTIRQNYQVDSSAEVTLEANPDDISMDKLEGWKQAGVNRLSMGVQSFFEDELRWMNRAHNSKQSLESIRMALEHFSNISVDLIYGSPLLTNSMWEENIDKVISLGIPHLSCYALTVEEKTPLHKSIRKNEKENVDGNRQAEQFLILMERLRTAGYEHYEVSNFARPGFRSRHNSSYWKGEKYLGLGPSAHSFDGSSRQWNVSNNMQYINSIGEGRIPVEKEFLSKKDRLNEFIMISLRTKEGLDLSRVKEAFGESKASTLEKGLQRFVNTGLLNASGTSYSLTDEGMLRADGIAAELFVVSS